MASKLQSPIDVPFNRGIRQDLESRTAPPGSLTTATNLEFDKSGKLVRRDGFTQAATTQLSKTHAYLAPAQRVATGARGEHLLFSNDNTWTHFPTKNGACEASLDNQFSVMRGMLVSSAYGGGDNAGNYLYSDCAFVAPWLVVAYTQLDSTVSLVRALYDVIDTTTGARVVTSAAAFSQSGTSVSGLVRPRVIACGTSVLIFNSYQSSIVCTFLDLSGSVVHPVVDTVVTDAYADAPFDVCCSSDGTTSQLRYVVTYARTAAKPRARLFTAQHPPTLLATLDWGLSGSGAAWTPTAITSRGADSGSLTTGWIVLIGSDSGANGLQYLWADYTLSLNSQNTSTPAVSTPNMLACISPQGVDDTWFAYSIFNSNTASDPRGNIYYGVLRGASTTPVGAIAANIFAGYSLGSRFFLSSDGTILSMGRFNDPSGAQSHYLLLDWGNKSDPTQSGTPGFSGFCKPTPVAHITFGRVPLLGNNSPLFSLSSLAALPNDRFVFTAPINVGAAAASGMQIQMTTWEAIGPKRFLSAPANGGLIVGGGTPLVYDSQRLVESSFYSYPCAGSSSFTQSTTGGQIMPGNYQYRFTWEWADSAGNRHQSPACPAIAVVVPAGTSTNKVTWTVFPLHATRKQTTVDFPYTYLGSPIPPAANDQASPVRLVMYRTTAGGTSFYRCQSIGVNNTSTSTAITVVDLQGDSSGPLASAEQLYVGFGVLPSTAPPPTVQPTVHAQRLWGVDSENPERVWCTKTFQDLESPGYSPGLEIIISGCGAVNGLGGQDGKLYALTERGVYLASYGDGPTNTGQGTFPTPALVTLTANCTEQRSVLVGQEGVYFAGQARWGTTIFIIPRGDGSPIDIGCRVRDELTACPIVRGAIDRQDKSRAEFLIVDSDTAPTKARLLYYHYDLRDEENIGQWTVAQYIDGRALYCLGQWDQLSVVSEITTPRISVQTSGATQDCATSWATRLETCDLRPFGMMGFGILDAVNVMATKQAASSVVVTASYDSGLTYPETFTWPNITAESVGAPSLRQWATPTKQLPFASVRIRIEDTAAASLSSVWHGLSIEVTPQGGTTRVPTAQMG